MVQLKILEIRLTMGSDFGKGCCYCLGLFLAHQEKHLFGEESKMSEFMTKEQWSLWFNASSDHFYDLQIPEILPVSVKKRLRKLQDKALIWGHGFREKGKATKEDYIWAIQEAKDLLRLIDKKLGVKTQKGQWE